MEERRSWPGHTVQGLARMKAQALTPHSGKIPDRKCTEAAMACSANRTLFAESPGSRHVDADGTVDIIELGQSPPCSGEEEGLWKNE
ncbi:uncharacterized protein N7511_009115 [Penicillium nucicola]|uniref:uncharacterized protein n=1 Tax=Penicillium nucicola TaxID=1850975 RepID=UPI0025451211|nr:uncharacterized protein N7511_009115 [Penicillium nucicola]KAJ5747419.1 hypothetical protein N7511_009115 [Penicillium nucicola]